MERNQFVRHSPSDASQFTGLEGELTVEKESWTIRVHDGLTPGGFVVLTQDVADGLYASLDDVAEQLDDMDTAIQTAADANIAALLDKVIVSRAPVKDIITTAPVSPAAGDRYLVAHSATVGVLAGEEDKILEYQDATTLRFGTPSDGHSVFVQDEQKRYYYSSGSGTWGTSDISLTDFASAIDTEIATAVADANVALRADILSSGLGDPFQNSLGSDNGYAYMPGGVLFQWGSYSGGADPVIVFPIAFGVARSVVLVAQGNGSRATLGVVSSDSFSTFTDGCNFNWQAVGTQP